MKAIRFYGNEMATIEEMAVPSPSADQALIKVAYAGICGSDIAIYRGLNKRATYPVTPGHEFVGTIEKLPEHYGGCLVEGQRVMVIPTMSCGTCWGCRNGLRHICDTIKFLGIQFDGGFAEYALAEIQNLRPLPDTLSFELGVLIEPIAVAIHAVGFLKEVSKKRILVFGGGPIGLMTALIARLEGAQVIVAEPQASRRAAAQKFGFPTIDPSTADPQEIKAKYTDSIGFDAFLECAGHPSTFQFMIATAKQKSHIIIVATYKQPPFIDIFMMSRKEMHIDISWTYFDIECEQAIDVLKKDSELFRSLVTHVFPLEETDTAMHHFIDGGDTLKVSIKVEQV